MISQQRPFIAQAFELYYDIRADASSVCQRLLKAVADLRERLSASFQRQPPL